MGGGEGQAIRIRHTLQDEISNSKFVVSVSALVESYISSKTAPRVAILAPIVYDSAAGVD